MDNNNLEVRKKDATMAIWWSKLCELALVSILLKTYSFIIMLWDIFYLVLYTVFAIFNSLFLLIKPTSLKSIRNEVALVVGASRGVGREIAFELAQLGTKVICIDINKEGNEKIVRKIKSFGYEANGYKCDVTNKNEIENIIKQIESEVGEITMLFHCCGVPSPRSISEPPSIQTTLDVSVVSHFLLLDQILPKMKKQKHGHVVFLTSVAGLSGNKHQMPLSVSQFAVQGIYESLIDDVRISRLHNSIYATIVHIYPFIVSKDLATDIRLRIPSYFGTISSTEAAGKIIDGVRRNKEEISIPKYILYLGHLLKLLPRKSTAMLRELLDTGLDFG